MKKKIQLSIKKLELKKTMIASLSIEEMSKINGGGGGATGSFADDCSSRSLSKTIVGGQN